MEIQLNGSIAILNQSMFKNGEILIPKQESSVELLSKAYSELGITYPKYFKMDNLCKTGFLAVEELLRDKSIKENYTPEEVAVVISTRNSSLDTDAKYWDSTFSNPSPSAFVYTLPNVLIGELSIRNGIKGESACFVFDTFDAGFQADYVNMLFETVGIKACISGWVDYFDSNAEAFFYLAELKNTNSSVPHSAALINNIYSKIWRN